MFNIIYCKKNQPVLNQPISSRSKEKTNVLVCATCMCNVLVFSHFFVVPQYVL